MTDVTTIHQPVLLRDCVDLVAPALANPGSIAVDSLKRARMLA